MKQRCVYNLANRPYGTIYIGVTTDVVRRVWEHKNGFVDGFTKRHHVHMLVHMEFHGSIEDAIVREKRLKKWRRDWKINLIEQSNPQWLDLYSEVTMAPRLRGGDEAGSRR